MTFPPKAAGEPPVLIADDDPAFRAFVAQLMERLSLPVVQLATGADALRIARGDRPALVMLDIRLPDVSGFEVCHELRDEFGENLPIILVSGEKTDDLDRAAGLLLGADDYLVKPVNATLLTAQVRRLVRRARATDDCALGIPPRPRPVTAREQEVLELLADGNDRAAIARRLVISPRTVGSHIEHLLSKLGVHSQAQAVAAAYREGLIGPVSRDAGPASYGRRGASAPESA
jgi:two-component system, NarL family, nitrate/nitrite response regulator NarL